MFIANNNFISMKRIIVDDNVVTVNVKRWNSGRHISFVTTHWQHIFIDMQHWLDINVSAKMVDA